MISQNRRYITGESRFLEAKPDSRLLWFADVKTAVFLAHFSTRIFAPRYVGDARKTLAVSWVFTE